MLALDGKAHNSSNYETVCNATFLHYQVLHLSSLYLSCNNNYKYVKIIIVF